MKFPIFNLTNLIHYDEPDAGGNPPAVDEPTVIIINDVEYKQDADGNALAEDGSIFKTKDDIAGMSDTPTFVTIGEDTFNLDAQGNAIDTDGKIIHTKEQLVDIANKPPTVDFFDAAREVIQFIPKNDKGEDIVYEKTTDGLKSFINDSLSVVIPQVKEEAVKEFFNANPDIFNAYRHKQAYGTIDDYKTQIDYRTIKIDDNNVEQLKNIIIHEQMIKGNTKDFAIKLATLSEKDGTLVADAKASKMFLDTHSKKNEDTINQTIKAKADAKLEEDRKYWTSVHQKVLTDGKLNVDGKDIIIPSVFTVNNAGRTETYTRQDFINYIEQPIVFKTKDGRDVRMTRNEYDIMLEESKHTVDHDLYESLMRFTKQNSTSVIEAQLKAKEVAHIKRLYDKSQVKTKSLVQGGGAGAPLLPIK